MLVAIACIGVVVDWLLDPRLEASSDFEGHGAENSPAPSIEPSFSASPPSAHGLVRPFEAEETRAHGVLQGRVVDYAGAPVPGAVVRRTVPHSSGEETAEIVTDSRGAFSLPVRDRLGAIDCHVRAEGFFSRTVGAAASVGPIEIALARASPLTIRVQSNTGDPIPGAELEWESVDDSMGSDRPWVTDDQGVTVIRGVPQCLHLQVVAPGFAPLWQRLTLPTSEPMVTVNLDPLVELGGSVIAGDGGTPIVEATIELWAFHSESTRTDFGGVHLETTRSDAAGGFTLRRFPTLAGANSGRVAALLLWAPGYAPAWITPPTRAQPPFVCNLFKAAGVKGRVVDARGDGIPGIVVVADAGAQGLGIPSVERLRMYGPSTDHWAMLPAQDRLSTKARALREVTTNHSGEFEFEHLPSVPAGSWVALSAGASAEPARVVTVTPGTVASVPPIVLHETDLPPTLRGIVTDEAGRPIASARLGLPGGAETLSDSHGHFSLAFDPVPGQRTLWVNADGFEADSVAMTRCPSRLELVLNRAEVVKVTVVDADQSPVVAARVRLLGPRLLREAVAIPPLEEPALSHDFAVTDADGTAVIQGAVWPADFEVTLEERWGRRQFGFEIATAVEGRIVLRLPWRRPATHQSEIRLRVFCADGVTAFRGNVTAVIQREDVPPLMAIPASAWMNREPGVRFGRSGAMSLQGGGDLRFPPVAPSFGRLEVRAQGHPVVRRDFDVSVDGTDLSVNLLPGLRLAGSVQVEPPNPINPLHVTLTNEKGELVAETKTEAGQFRFGGLSAGTLVLEVGRLTSGDPCTRVQSHATAAPVSVRLNADIEGMAVPLQSRPEVKLVLEYPKSRATPTDSMTVKSVESLANRLRNLRFCLRSSDGLELFNASPSVVMGCGISFESHVPPGDYIIEVLVADQVHSRHPIRAGSPPLFVPFPEVPPN